MKSGLQENGQGFAIPSRVGAGSEKQWQPHCVSPIPTIPPLHESRSASWRSYLVSWQSEPASTPHPLTGRCLEWADGLELQPYWTSSITPSANCPTLPVRMNTVSPLTHILGQRYVFPIPDLSLNWTSHNLLDPVS